MNEADLKEMITTIAHQVQLKMATPQALPDPDGCSVPGRTTPCNANASTCTNHGHCLVRKPQAVENMIARGATRIGAGPGMARPDSPLARYIDHTLLKPEATREQLTQICKEAMQHGFATVCVNAVNVPFVARQLSGSSVKCIAVVGFPLGASTPSSKAFEAREAVRAGAQEIDMVINIGALKSRDLALVYQDIAAVVEASRPYKVKVILETSKLNEEEKVIACALSKAARAHFVKTSTGFGGGGATVDDVALMRRVVGEDMEVKASGGIRNRETAEKMVQAGANRIGASASVAIVTGGKASGGGY